MTLNLIFDILTFLLVVYLIVRLWYNTTEFEYRIICGINKVYNWFKNCFKRNGK